MSQRRSGRRRKMHKNDSPAEHPYITELKRDAKRHSKQFRLSFSRSLAHIANSKGYSSWKELVASVIKPEQSRLLHRRRPEPRERVVEPLVRFSSAPAARKVPVLLKRRPKIDLRNVPDPRTVTGSNCVSDSDSDEERQFDADMNTALGLDGSQD